MRSTVWSIESIGSRYLKPSSPIIVFSILLLFLIVSSFPQFPHTAIVSYASSTLAVDGSGQNRTATTKAEECKLTTSDSSDLIIVNDGIGSGSGAFSSIQDVAGLTWSTRQIYSPGNALQAYQFYAESPLPLTTDVITVTLTVAENQAINCFGVNGYNSLVPFDGISHNFTTTAQTIHEVDNLTTTNPNDMIIGFCVCAGSVLITAGTDYTLITTILGGPTVGSVYQTVSSIQNNLLVDEHSSGTKDIFLADAINSAPSASCPASLVALNNKISTDQQFLFPIIPLGMLVGVIICAIMYSVSGESTVFFQGTERLNYEDSTMTTHDSMFDIFSKQVWILGIFIVLGLGVIIIGYTYAQLASAQSCVL